MSTSHIQDARDSQHVEAWAEATIGAMDNLCLTTPTSAIVSTLPRRNMRGTTVSLDIPLDAEALVCSNPRPAVFDVAESDTGHMRRREPMRRDSMKRREALLKGKEGSRRRQKWENDHLLGNPWLAPPCSADYEVQPTHPVKSIPYFLASLWDERAAKLQDQARQRQVRASQARMRAGPEVPRALRATMKRSKGAKNLLQDLEEQVRAFVASQRRKESADEDDQDAGFDKLDSEDSEEEVVFVGRNGGMHDMTLPRSPRAKRGRDKLLFETPVEDRGGTFGRYLVHELAAYYDLHAWSITTGDPARREAYICIPPSQPPSDPHRQARHGASLTCLPRPLWGLV